MKKIIALILAALMVFTLCACGGNSTSSKAEATEAPAQEEAATEAEADADADAAEVEADADADAAADEASEPTYVFTFGTVDTEEHPSTMSARKLGEILNEKAPGKWQIDVYPNSTLGGAAEIIESIQMGNVDMACPATSFIANYAPSLGVLDLPYMFTNTTEAYTVLDGEIGQQFAADVESAGIKCLTFWEVGFRCLANSKREINSVDDVAGLRLRIISNDVHQALFTALGVDPVPMDLAEALVANQQGTIDGMDNPLSGLYTTSVYEFDKYIAVTNHVYTAQAVVMSQKAWESMTAEDQEIFMEAVKETTQFDREEQARQTADAAASLEAKGCEISYPDVSGFAEKMDEVYAQFPQYADTIAAIKEVTASIK